MYTESVIWGFIDTYLEFLKSFLIIMGFYFTLFGKRMEDVLHCGAGYLTVVAIAIFIYFFKTVEFDVYKQGAETPNYDDTFQTNTLMFRNYFWTSSASGVFTGFIVATKERIGAALLAAWAGIFSAIALFQLCLFYIG